MTTKMQMAFVSSPSVTMNTPLGKMILQTAAIQLHAEEQRIRIFQAKKAEERQKQAELYEAVEAHMIPMKKVEDTDQLLPQV